MRKRYILSVLVALLAAFSFIAICQRVFQPKTQLNNGEMSIEQIDGDESEPLPGSEDVSLELNTEGVVNILIIGQDTRTGERERSDSMILASFNENSGEMTMISFMRDLYVEIPGYNAQKLNAAYQYGGAELLDETLKENFDVDIDYNVEIDFDAFKEIIDTIGGVDIEIDEEEAEYLRGEGGNYHLGKAGYYTGGRTYDVEVGTVHMDGKMALDYSRARHVGNSDYGRTLRQRKVIKTIYSIVKKEDWLTLYRLFTKVQPYITTDLSVLQMANIGYKLWKASIAEINSYRIPANGMFDEVNDETHGDVLMIRDWNETQELIRNYIYSDDGGRSVYEQLIEDHGVQE